MEEGTVLRFGTDQKELCLVLPDACLYVSRIVEGYFAWVEKTYAGKILLQLQKSGARFVQGIGNFNIQRCRKISRVPYIDLNRYSGKLFAKKIQKFNLFTEISGEKENGS
jgi:hypothetical protein